MFIKIGLIVSVLLQLAAGLIAISLIKRTKYNISWILISTGLVLMSIRRVFEISDVFDPSNISPKIRWDNWLAFLVSVFFLVGVIFIKRIFNFQKQLDELRKHNESKILSAILRTEENERQKFAKELHDGMGPLLSSIKMSISALSRSKNIENEKKIVENTSKLIDESLVSLKEISNKLSPHILNNFGLLKAIQSLISKFSLNDGPAIDLKSNIENKRYDFNIEVVLFRVVSELITNTVKHALANKVSISIIEDNNHINLGYFDDGVGFDDKLMKNFSKGMGYSNIQSRIKSLNGTLLIESKPNEGLQVNISLKIR
ncbi:MAG: histidine kinase [Bacteroidales bacterium]